MTKFINLMKKQFLVVKISQVQEKKIKANFMPRKITHSENQAYPPKQSDHTVYKISSMLFQWYSTSIRRVLIIVLRLAMGSPGSFHQKGQAQYRCNP